MPDTSDAIRTLISILTFAFPHVGLLLYSGLLFSASSSAIDAAQYVLEIAAWLLGGVSGVGIGYLFVRLSPCLISIESSLSLSASRQPSPAAGGEAQIPGYNNKL